MAAVHLLLKVTVSSNSGDLCNWQCCRSPGRDALKLFKRVNIFLTYCSSFFSGWLEGMYDGCIGSNYRY